MNVPTDKEIVEACAHLLEKDIVWLVGGDSILEASMCYMFPPAWNPLTDGKISFDLLTGLSFNLEVTTSPAYPRDITVCAHSHYGQATYSVTSDTSLSYTEVLRQAYKRVVALAAYDVWDTHKKAIRVLVAERTEMVKIFNERTGK